ncbi:MAG: hypothetical protein ABEK00_02765 [Candidatus Nanohaloarchaea archaeon]
MSEVYYQCPDCGYKQRSKAQKRVKCHNCGRSYLKRDAKKFKEKTSDMDKEDREKAGFHKYSRSSD